MAQAQLPNSIAALPMMFNTQPLTKATDIASRKHRPSPPTLTFQQRPPPSTTDAADLTMSVSDFLAEIEERRLNSARQERLKAYAEVQDGLGAVPLRPETAPVGRTDFSKSSSIHRRRLNNSSGGGGFQQRLSSASGFREPRQCLRSHTPESERIPSVSNSPNMLTAAETCQLLGPQVCRFCDSGNRRSRELDRSQSAFHGLEVSTENFASILSVKRRFPHLDTSQLRELVGKGTVKKNVFLGFLHRCAEKAHEDLEKLQQKARERAESSADYISDAEDEQLFITAQQHGRGKGSRSSVAPDGSSWSFFMNLSDLNSKVLVGRLPRSLVGDDPEENKEITEENLQRWRQKKRSSFLETVNPQFISPRKAKLTIEPKTKQYYEPPLLQLEQQTVTNAFFAGQKSEYKLAEKLPDNLLPPGIANEVDEYFSKTEYEAL